MFLGCVIIIGFIVIIRIIRNEINEVNEKRIINIVLSKLDFSPKYHKIIKKDNKIFIKCHYYSKEFSHLLFNNEILNIIKTNKDGFYIRSNINDNNKLVNYNPNKNLGIIVFDIMINLIIDDNNYYSNIINYLENPEYYIQINNIYDDNLEFYYKYDECIFETFYYKLNCKKIHHLYNPNMKFNITFTNTNNNKNNFSIYPILLQNGSFPNFNIEISKDINTKPHINNKSFKINKMTGTFI
jgi:hypothetical protein